MTATLEISDPKCVADVKARLGEGPLWDPRIKRLLFLDIKGEKIFLYDPHTNRTETVDAPGEVSAVGIATHGYICARRDGFAHLKIINGEASFETIADPEADLPGNRFNDGKVDPLGGFWAGTMDDAELGSATGSWWRLSPDGKTEKRDAGYVVCNGPAFDMAFKRVYLTDSAKRKIFVAETGGADLRNKRTFLEFDDSDGYPDGMDVDRESCLWVAFWDGACVKRFSPEGDLLETIALPVPRPTSVKLVGDRIFITSARIGFGTERLEKAPLSGGLFEATLSRPLGERKLALFSL